MFAAPFKAVGGGLSAAAGAATSGVTAVGGRFGVRFYYGANSFQDLGMHDTAVDAAVAYARFAASQAAESDTRNGPMANGLTCQAAPAEEEVEKDEEDE